MKNSSNNIVGTILITFDLPNEESVLLTTHSSQNSVDIRDDYFKQLADLDIDKDALHIQFPKKQKAAGTDESVEKLRKELANENSKLRDKEENLKLLFEKAKKESAKLKKAKAELQRCRESLKRREQSLQMEEIEVMHEKETIEQEREDLMKLKAQLSHDFAKLKQERQKLQVEKRDIETTTKELGSTSKKITREKVILKKSSLQLKLKQTLMPKLSKLETSSQNLDLNMLTFSTEPCCTSSPEIKQRDRKSVV